MRKTLITYKTWRTTHNPWLGNNFIGNLDPNNPDEANLIDEIHSYIDEYYAPRFIGVKDPERFMILFMVRLASIETNFFKSFMLDRNYDELVEMLNTINTSDNETSSNEQTSTLDGTVDNTRTDNLLSTKSRRQDNGSSNSLTREDIGSRSDIHDTTFGGSVVDTSEYNKTETQGGSTKVTSNNTQISNNRTVSSAFPQSIVGDGSAGIDANLNWNYATGAQDDKASQTTNGTNNTEHGMTVSSNGTDSKTTQDKRTVTETTDIGIQSNDIDQNIINQFTEGEQSVENTGTQTNKQINKSNGSHTSNVSKNNKNTGRSENLANIRKDWRSLLHRTLTAYQYLFENLENLFVSVWDIDEDDSWEII